MKVERERRTPVPQIALFLLLSAVLLILFREIAATTILWEDRPRQVILFFASFFVYLIAVRLFRPSRVQHSVTKWVWAIITFGALFRLAVIPYSSIQTTDIYRYVWEGKMVNRGVNPYVHSPDDPALKPLRNEIYRNIGFKSLPTIYPPFSQLVFALIYRLKPDDTIAFKAAFALFDIGTCLLLPGLLAAFGLSPLYAIIYAWHPLAVVELSARGHQDAVGIFFLVLALRIAIARPRFKLWAAPALCASVLAKGYSLFLLPFFFLSCHRQIRRGEQQRRKWAFAALFLAAAAIFTLPFAGAGRGLLSTLTRYMQEWQGNASIFWLVDFALRPLAHNHFALARLLCGLVFLAFLIHRIARHEAASTGPLVRISPADLFWVLGAFFLLSAAAFPWYLVWTLPLLCFVRNLPWLVLSGTLFGFYAHKIFAPTEVWWITLLEYAVPLLVAMCRARPLLQRFAGARPMAENRKDER